MQNANCLSHAAGHTTQRRAHITHRSHESIHRYRRRNSRWRVTRLRFHSGSQERDLVTYESTTCTMSRGLRQSALKRGFPWTEQARIAHGPDFGFDEVIRAALVPASSYPSGYAAHDEESIRHLLQTMADLLEAYCMALLRGDDAAWLRLMTQRDTDAARYAAENSLRLALSGATEAWHAKEFAKVIELLGPKRHLLGTADQAKLEYAEGKLRRHDCPWSDVMTCCGTSRAGHHPAPHAKMLLRTRSTRP